MKHTLSILVENKPGVLARVAGLFSRRGFNIDSLAVAVTEKPELSRMTVVVDVEEHSLEQVHKQLNKLINVIKVTDLPAENSVQRELVLFKVKTNPNTRAEIIEIVDIFRGKIVDVGSGTLGVEITGTGTKIKALEDLLKPYGVVECARTGMVALPRG
ncbi:MAG: acetolactate synthase small subunit [Actinobacteria bacterium]|nr:acetolactate synthase small subunit [Actinomycetota bacterium]MCG2817657.1 acetolactate synthase small subunit [Actinomycetes bacterium]MBU4179700.1 acetolactate synthase small subunit [Actinomycetota bacterium]MBU4219330.1 acetolactate synthase small subunit [Actinomycetota bacterium]MBU4359614.1 acetolactate synthase small subunit [Actinomycetota bacterium]